MIRVLSLVAVCGLLPSLAFAQFAGDASKAMQQAFQQKLAQSCPASTKARVKYAGLRKGSNQDMAVVYLFVEGDCPTIQGWVRLSCEKLDGKKWACVEQMLKDAVIAFEE